MNKRVRKIKERLKVTKIQKRDVIKIAELAISSSMSFESYDGWLEHLIMELETKFNIKVL